MLSRQRMRRLICVFVVRIGMSRFSHDVPAQLKFVMTECSKTQIPLTGLSQCALLQYNTVQKYIGSVN